MISKTRARKVIAELAELKETVLNKNIYLEEENKTLNDKLKILEGKLIILEVDIQKLKK